MNLTTLNLRGEDFCSPDWASHNRRCPRIVFPVSASQSLGPDPRGVPRVATERTSATSLRTSAFRPCMSFLRARLGRWVGFPTLAMLSSLSALPIGQCHIFWRTYHENWKIPQQVDLRCNHHYRARRSGGEEKTKLLPSPNVGKGVQGHMPRRARRRAQC